MNKYENGKIYKLVSNQTDKIYIGSTCEKYLSNRLSKHKGSYKRYLNGKYGYMTSYKLLKYDDCQIILLKAYPCNSKYELEAKEREFIENLDCVNKYIPTRTIIEYRKEYKKENKEKIKKYNILYQKEYIKKYIFCYECGHNINLAHKARHNKTQTHQTNQKQWNELLKDY